MEANEQQDVNQNVRSVHGLVHETFSIYQKSPKRTEREKWKTLHRRKKVQYFLDYYSGITAGIIICVAIITFLIVHFAMKKEVVMGILAVNTDGSNIVATGPEYFDDFLKDQDVDSKRKQVNVNYTMYIDASSTEFIDRTNLEAIQTLFMTQSVDVFFSDQEFFQCMAGSDYIADLRDYLPEELLDKYAEDIVYADDAEAGENIVAGIRLKDNKWVIDTGWYNSTVVVGLANEMKDQKLAEELLREILQ